MKKRKKTIIIILLAISIFIVAFIFFGIISKQSILHFLVNKGVEALEERYDINIFVDDFKFVGLTISFKVSSNIKDTAYSIRQVRYHFISQRFELSRIICSKGNDIIVQIEKVSGAIKILPLLKSNLKIKKLKILSPEIYLEVDELGNPVLPDYKLGTEVTEEPSSSEYKIITPDMKVIGGYIKLPSQTGINFSNLEMNVSCSISNLEQDFALELNKCKINHEKVSMQLKGQNIEGHIEDNILTLKNSTFKTLFGDINITGEINNKLKPSIMNLNIDSDLSLLNLSQKFQLKDSLKGYAKIHTLLKGTTEQPDITGWISIKDAYIREIKTSDVYIPFELLARKEKDGDKLYRLMISDGNVDISDISKAWTLQFPNISLNLSTGDYFRSFDGSLMLMEPVYNVKGIEIKHDSLFAKLKSNNKKLELTSAELLWKGRISHFKGNIDFSDDLTVSLDYDIKPDPDYEFRFNEDISLMGLFDIKGSLYGNKKDLTTNGRLEARNIVCGDASIKELSFEYEYLKNQIICSNIQTLISTGKVFGNISLKPGFEPYYFGELFFENVDISCFNPFLKGDNNLTGLFSGFAFLETTDFDPELTRADAELKIIDGSIIDRNGNYPFYLDSHIQFDTGNLLVDHLNFLFAGTRADVKGSLKIAGKQEFEYIIESSNLSKIGQFVNLPIESGSLKLNGTSSGNWQLPDIEMDIDIQDLNYGELIIDKFSGAFEGYEGNYRLDNANLIFYDLTGDLLGNLAFGLKDNSIDYKNLNLNGNLRTQNFHNPKLNFQDINLTFKYFENNFKCRLNTDDNKVVGLFSLKNKEKAFTTELKVIDFETIDYLNAFIKGKSLSNLDSINISLSSEISGIIGKNQSIMGKTELSKLTLSNKYIHLTNKYPIHVILEKNILKIPEFELYTNNSQLKGKFTIDNFEECLLELNGLISLDEISKLGYIDKTFGGLLTVSSVIKGTLENPQLDGILTISNGSYLLEELQQSITEVSGNLLLKNNNINIEKITGKFGNGTITSNGEINIKEILYDLNFNLGNVNIVYGDGLNTIINGTLTFKGSADSALLTGDISPSYLKYSKPIHWKEWLLFFKKQREEIIDESQNKLPINFTLRIEAQRNIWLDSNIAKVQSDLDLYLYGSKNNPSLHGRINLLEGNISLKEMGLEHTNFKVTSGTIDFINPSEINPICDIRCETSIENINVFLYLNGPADDLNLKFESEPSLDDYSILYLLATGKLPGDNNEAPNFNLDSFTNLIIGNIKDTIVETSRENLPVDEIELEPIISGSERTGGVRLTTSKKVDRIKVTYSIILGTSEEDLVYIEYKINDFFYLTGEKNEEGGIGGGIKLRLSF